MQMIASMNLAESRATLLLEDFPDSGSDYDGDDVTPDNEAPKPERKKGQCMRRVVVDLTLNAFNNAEVYYEERRAALGKRERTEQVHPRLLQCSPVDTYHLTFIPSEALVHALMRQMLPLLFRESSGALLALIMLHLSGTFGTSQGVTKPASERVQDGKAQVTFSCTTATIPTYNSTVTKGCPSTVSTTLFFIRI